MGPLPSLLGIYDIYNYVAQTEQLVNFSSNDGGKAR